MINLNKRIVLVGGLVLSFLLIAKVTFAQSPTIEDEKKNTKEMEVVIDGKEVDEATSTSTEAIKELILKKVTEQSDSSTNLDNLNSWRKAVLGEVEKITDDSISIVTKSGTLIIATNKNLSFKKNEKNINAKNVEIGNWALVIGTIKVSEKKQADLLTGLQPQIVYIYDQSPKPKEPFVEIGTLKNQNSTSIDLLSRRSKDELSILTKQTKYQNLAGESLNANNLEKDTAILVVGFKEKEAFTATSIVSLIEMTPSDEKP